MKFSCLCEVLITSTLTCKLGLRSDEVFSFTNSDDNFNEGYYFTNADYARNTANWMATFGVTPYMPLAGAVLAFFDANRDPPAKALAKAFIEREDFFGPDLKAVPGFEEAVACYLKGIEEKGVRAVMEKHFA